MRSEAVEFHSGDTGCTGTSTRYGTYLVRYWYSNCLKLEAATRTGKKRRMSRRNTVDTIGAVALSCVPLTLRKWRDML